MVVEDEVAGLREWVAVVVFGGSHSGSVGEWWGLWWLFGCGMGGGFVVVVVWMVGLWVVGLWWLWNGWWVFGEWLGL